MKHTVIAVMKRAEIGICSVTKGVGALGKHAYGGHVQCPYYKYEGERMIYCEGVTPETALHLAFRTKDKLRAYRSVYCEGNYKNCLIAQMLNRKYDYEQV